MMTENLPKEITQRSKFIRIAFITALAMLSFFLLAETVLIVRKTVSYSAPATNTIVVTGNGKAYAAPDTATVSYTITKVEPKVSDAQTDVTKIENKALDVLKKNGITDNDVRTTSYSISPNYIYRPCVKGYCYPTKKDGYKVSQTVSLKIHKLSIVGSVVGALGDIGVSNLSGPNFVVDDPTSIKNEARAEAIGKAKTQAEKLAKLLGVHVVRIVNYKETTYANHPIVYGVKSSAETGTSTNINIPAGQNEYAVNVSITYEIR
ncbi:MAG TPA: DUF541 domain-containing protein [Candidatus Kaiserbacteria bacterium]|nr:DUF541 domain-containing protein [Candidatus Kaiserbacteria bacterium]